MTRNPATSDGAGGSCHLTRNSAMTTQSMVNVCQVRVAGLPQVVGIRSGGGAVWPAGRPGGEESPGQKRR
jgi:hypothetical protein